jgi:hypothetical protein
MEYVIKASRAVQTKGTHTGHNQKGPHIIARQTQIYGIMLYLYCERHKIDK